MTTPRLLRFGIIGLVIAQCIVWLVAGSIVWSFRDLMVGSGSPQAAHDTQFALAIFVGAAVNLVALVPFLIRSGGLSVVLLLAVQAADLVVTLIEGVLVSPWWWLITVAAGLTLALMYVFRRAPVRVAARVP